MLMAVPDPCIHLFGDLTLIVAMKEIRGGQRLERLLSNALTLLDEFISIAFVFGSVARVEQVRESDVDLMIVGDVRLKDLAAALHSGANPGAIRQPCAVLTSEVSRAVPRRKSLRARCRPQGEDLPEGELR